MRVYNTSSKYFPIPSTRILYEFVIRLNSNNTEDQLQQSNLKRLWLYDFVTEQKFTLYQLAKE